MATCEKDLELTFQLNMQFDIHMNNIVDKANRLLGLVKRTFSYMDGPQGFWGSGENGYLFSGIWGALVIILGELGRQLIVLGI